MNPMEDEDELGQLLALGGQNASADKEIKMQMAQAQRLRAGNTLEARSNGRVVTSPHWLEAAASVGRELKAQGVDKQVASASKAQDARTQEQNALILRSLTRKPRQTSVNPWTPAGMGDDGLETFPVN